MNYLVLSKPQICIFKIPQLSTSKGYFLADWTEMIWEGSCLVESVQGELQLRLKQGDKIFAQTSVPKNYDQVIKKCNDSSRGFAIRLENNGKFAWVGAAFRERADAFDFNVCFSDFYGKDKEVKEIKTQDFSFNRNKKITLNLGKNTSTNQQNLNQIPSQSQIENKNQFPDFFDVKPNKPKDDKHMFDDNQFQNFNTDFGDFSNFSQNQPKQDPKQGDLLDFDFGSNSNKPQNAPQQNNLLDFDFGGAQKKQENLLDF